MSECKPITGELREAMGINNHYTMNGDEVSRTYIVDRDNFIRLCDAIDIAHAALEVENERYHDNWVELPKDADGVPIRVGDKLRFDNGIIVEVRYLKIDSDGTSVCVLAADGGGDFYAITDKAHHYHEPTVEDVLREFAFEIGLSATDDDVVAKYAKRLTLGGDAE